MSYHILHPGVLLLMVQTLFRRLLYNRPGYTVRKMFLQAGRIPQHLFLCVSAKCYHPVSYTHLPTKQQGIIHCTDQP